MTKKLTRAELVYHVEVLQSGKWDEQEMVRLFTEIASSVPCPSGNIQEYIFYSDGFTPDEIVQKMLDYKPIAL